ATDPASVELSPRARAHALLLDDRAKRMGHRLRFSFPRRLSLLVSTLAPTRHHHPAMQRCAALSGQESPSTRVAKLCRGSKNGSTPAYRRNTLKVLVRK